MKNNSFIVYQRYISSSTRDIRSLKKKKIKLNNSSKAREKWNFQRKRGIKKPRTLRLLLPREAYSVRLAVVVTFDRRKRGNRNDKNERLDEII